MAGHQIHQTKKANTNVFSFVRSFVNNVRAAFQAPQMLMANAA